MWYTKYSEDAMSDTTTIKLNVETRDDLRELGSCGESFDKIVSRLIDLKHATVEYVHNYVQAANGDCVTHEMFGRLIIANHVLEKGVCTRCGWDGVHNGTPVYTYIPKVEGAEAYESISTEEWLTLSYDDISSRNKNQGDFIEVKMPEELDGLDIIGNTFLNGSEQ